MKVTIDDMVTVECSHLRGRDINGWVLPVFSAEQLADAVNACEAVGFIVRDADGVAVDSEYRSPVITDLGEGEFILGEGWVWDVSEWNTCEDCGQAVTPVAGCLGLNECGC